MRQQYPFVTRRALRSFALAAAAAAALPALSSAQTSGTWIADVGTAGGSWNNPGNWADGVVADNGGTATFPTLATFTTAPVNILQDEPTVTLSGINFESRITYLIRSTTLGATSLTLTGPAVVNTPDPATNTLSSTFFGHQLQIPIAGSAGLTKNGPGTLTLWQPSTFTGAVNVNGGIVVARQFGDAVFGNSANAINLNDGTIRVTTGAWSSNRTINLSGNGTIEASTTGTTSFNGPVIGTGDLNKIGSRGLVLNAGNAYTGATNVLAGSLGLSGNGAISQTSSLTSRDAIVIDNGFTNLTNRVNDAAPVVLQGSALTFTGSASAPSSETLGTTTFSRGTSVVTVTPAAGQRATLAFAGPSRDTGGAAHFRGTSLGAAPGADVANVIFATPPALVGGGGAAGSTNVSIIPWAIGNTNAAAPLNAASNSFVTYGVNGVRPLDVNTEYQNQLPLAGPTENVRLNGATSVAGVQTINSLILTGTSIITGGGTLTVTSGALMNLTNGLFIDANLNLGAAEAMIFAPASISFNGVITGSGGLTKQGAGVATFAAANTYTGTTTIGGGTAVFRTDVPASGAGPFGASSSAIVLAPAGLGTGGTTGRLVYSGSGTGNFNRPLNVTGRIALNNAATIPGFGVNTATTLNMNGDITLDESPLTFVGAGGSTLVINGDISGTGGPVTDQASNASSVIRLNGNNTFTEGTEMASATWEVGSDSAFGTGTLKMVQLSGQPTIRAVGGPRVVPNDTVAFSFSTNYWQIAGDQPITFTGSINLSGSYTHNINNTALTTYAGVLHTGGFTKSGTGTLVLSGDNVYTGNTSISSGALRVTHAGALGGTAAPTIVGPGAALEIAGNALSSEPVTINGVGISANGAIRSLSGSNSLGPVTLNSTSMIGVDAGTLATGNVSSSVSTAGLFKFAPGTLSARRYRLTAVDVQTGTAAVTPGRSTDKTSVLNTLLIAGGARFDLGDNDLVLDYSTNSPLLLVRGHIANGYANGAWTGAGLTSSLADASQFALGYGEASSVFTTFPATFSGVQVDDTSVLVRWTRYGDATLDGQVTLDDFNRFAANFGASNAVWTQGDFDYNGIVNLNDFNKLAANFGLSAAGPQVTPEDWARLGAAVPEPAGVWVGVIGAVLPLLRRRRAS